MKIKQYKKFQGIFSIIYDDGTKRMASKNLTPGHKVYGEDLIQLDNKEYRLWDPTRSKLAAAIIKGINMLPIKSGAKVLYLGAASGTTPSHISDVIGLEGFMYCVEFFADKTPGVDSGWDTLHTFIRIPAGVLLAAGAVGDVNPAAALAAGIVGGGIAAGTHATKSGTRLLINTSPEPVTNWTASIVEDLAVIGGLWAALQHPYLFLGLFAVFVLLVIWLLPKIWKGIKKIFTGIVRFFKKKQAPSQTGD